MKIYIKRFSLIFNMGAIVLFFVISNPIVTFANDKTHIGLTEETGILDKYNHAIFSFNGFIYSYFPESSIGLTPPAPEKSPSFSTNLPNSSVATGHAQSGFGAVLSNIVNEPITIVSSLLVGEVKTAWNAANRFGINSTYGVLGWWDEASMLGYKQVAADIGLSLCRMGVGEGGYVVLPFVGPRTVRDAVADIAVINLLLWSATGFLFNSGVSVQTIAIAETIEVAVDIFATRQIDPNAKKLSYTNFDEMRQNYLNQRRERCSG